MTCILRSLLAVLVAVGVLAISVLTGTLLASDPNATARWSPTGTPLNCQALIAENIRGWRKGDFTAESALNSIDRWCGLQGALWGK
jgi:hypothetical protein